MPKRFLLGHLPRINTRRLTLFLVVLSVCAIGFITVLSSAVPKVPRLSDYEQKTKITVAKITAATETTATRIPSRIDGDDLAESPLDSANRSQKPGEAPPRSQNDGYGASSWWVDPNWLAVPISSALTTDDRTLLPPLEDRPPIYCYYDETAERPQDERDAVADLHMTWKRAWWAHGFRPIILGAAEARANPNFARIASLELNWNLKADLMRWLAWDTMGGGLLAQSTLLPMGAKDDAQITHLRKWQHSEITGWKGLREGLLAGPGSAVSLAVQAAPDSPGLVEAESMLGLLQDVVLHVHDRSSSLAFYGPETIRKKYGIVNDAAAHSEAAGLRELNALINAHLHITWQNAFSHGIEVLKPHPNHTTKMVSLAVGLAESLLTCPETPMPSSCPPNAPRCSPCTSTSKGTKILTVPTYDNGTNVFSIGVVPHPWTLTSLDLLRDTFDVTWVQQAVGRDPWVTEVTREIVDYGASTDSKMIHLKELMGSTDSNAHSLWLTAEDPLPPELDWHFGFTIPRQPLHTEEKPLDREHPAEDPTLEWILLERAKQVIAETESDEDAAIRASFEEWNPADTEAWKFARALQARWTMERLEWEKEEELHARDSSIGLAGWRAQ